MDLIDDSILPYPDAPHGSKASEFDASDRSGVIDQTPKGISNATGVNFWDSASLALRGW